LENLGDYEGAKQGYLRALEINRKAFGEDHTEYARTLQNLSIVLEKLGDYEGAKQGYLRALEIRRKHSEKTTQNMQGLYRIYQLSCRILVITKELSKDT
jgi:tetratricopeptide (TPR) repeat protein